MRVLLLVATLTLTLSACATLSTGDTGRRATGFSLPDLHGRTVSLSTYLARRDVIVMDFWATWCRPCLVELPFLHDLYVEHRDRGLTVLAISMDGPETESQVRPTARRYGWTFPVLLDRDTRVVSTYNPRRAAPFSLIIGRDGSIVYTHEGFVAGDREEMTQQIERALAVAR